MTDAIKSWFSAIHLLWVLVGAFVASIAYIVNWKADMESRIHTLEVRGSPHLAVVDNRLTVLEKQTESNLARIDRIIEVMLRELPVKKEQLK